jgi:hypothetical protein
VRVRPLDDLGIRPDFVMIEVEGFVQHVVTGLTQTIQRHQPIMLVETPESPAALMDHQALVGYRPFVYDVTSGLTPYDGQSSLNLVLLPASEPAA